MKPEFKVTNIREITKQGKKEFKEELHVLAKRHYHERFSSTPAVGYPILTPKEIDEIVNRLESLTEAWELEDVVYSTVLRHEIMGLVYDFFRDVRETYCDRDLALKPLKNFSLEPIRPIDHLNSHDTDWTLSEIEIEQYIA